MRQEILHDQDQIVQAEGGRASKLTDIRPLPFGRFPLQPPGKAAAIQATMLKRRRQRATARLF
uniref:hypothetical protein n=1 Tax=Gluconobacter wancherniae TaxID=1307955 RepID=UPI0020121FC4|nr:hypothetical protein [Gluconobacter wancherniae]